MPEAGRVVVITGGSAGIGRATALAFAVRGARLALLARGEAGLAGAQREVERAGGTALTLQADVADPAAVEAAAERIERELGPIDVWINNAMVSVMSAIRDLSAEEFRRVAEVTYLGVVHGTLSALRRMTPRGRGTIVQIVSALGYRSIPLQSAYCAAKHAVLGFTDSLRCELLHERSRLHLIAVYPPASDTPQFSWVRSHLPKPPRPLPPTYRPELTAEAIAWVVDHPRRELWIGGPTYAGILTQRLAPALVDRWLANRAWKGQQQDGARVPRDNLWKAQDAAEDFGVHGAFGGEARRRSFALWATQHRGLVAFTVLLLVTGAVILFL